MSTKAIHRSKPDKGRKPVGITVGAQTQALPRKVGKPTKLKRKPLSGPTYPGYAPN